MHPEPSRSSFDLPSTRLGIAAHGRESTHARARHRFLEYAGVRRVLLLGGTGFIGSHVLQTLRRRPDLALMVLGHRNVDYRALEDVNLVVSGVADLDFEWLEAFQPDTIIHLARLRGQRRIGRALAARRGRRANARLIEWLCARAPQTHVVYVSGTLVYGERGESETDELTEIRPASYAREYVLAEAPWMEAQREARLPVTIVRPPWVIGSASWFRQYFVLPALAGGSVPMYGSGRNWMSFLDVADCGAAVVHVAEHAEPGKSFNLFAPGQAARQEEFVGVVADALGVRVGRVERVKQGRRAERAIMEALTCSLRSATVHPEVAMGYSFEVTRWQDMVERHLPSQ